MGIFKTNRISFFMVLIGAAFLLSCSPESSGGGGEVNGGGGGASVKNCLVSTCGELRVSGSKIVGSKTGNNAVQLRGVSMGWSNTAWESAQYFKAEVVATLRSGWNVNVVRAPLGACDKPGSDGCDVYGGYLSTNGGDKSANMNRVKQVVTGAIANDIYVIIDWHTHIAQTADANAFFTEIITWLKTNNGGSVPANVIFEVYNEPINDTWASIKTHSESVISTIRGAGANNLVLVGTNNWSRRPDQAADSPLSDNNVAYVLHFYAQDLQLDSKKVGGGKSFREVIDYTLDKGYPVFVSEFGTVNSSGKDPHDAAQSDIWLDYLDEKNISWCAWQLSDKYYVDVNDPSKGIEGAAFFTPKGSGQAGLTNDANLKPSGKYIKDRLNSYK